MEKKKKVVETLRILSTTNLPKIQNRTFNKNFTSAFPILLFQTRIVE